MQEHRQAIATFDVDIYAKYNEDVVNAAKINGVINWVAIYQHYCTFGVNEKRRAV